MSLSCILPLLASIIFFCGTYHLIFKAVILAAMNYDLSNPVALSWYLLVIRYFGFRSLLYSSDAYCLMNVLINSQDKAKYKLSMSISRSFKSSLLVNISVKSE